MKLFRAAPVLPHRKSLPGLSETSPVRFVSDMRTALPLLHSSHLAVVIVLLASCSDQGTDPPAPDRPGIQYPVSWPSLASTPWPMNHGDPQSTGRSPRAGPLLTSSPISVSTTNGSEGGVAVTGDSLFVLGRHLKACTMSGVMRWSFVPEGAGDYFITTPIVRNDGVILSATIRGILYAISDTGGFLWRLDLGEEISNQGSNIGLDGTFYCIGSLGTLFAVSRDGSLRWSVHDVRFSGNHRAVLTMSPDGRTIYVPGEGVAVNAVDVQSQAVRWRFGTIDRLMLAPIVDSYGNVYVLAADSPAVREPSLFSIRPEGTTRWAFTHGNHFNPVNAGDPTIDANGNIYFAFDTLYSVDWEGQLRWKKSLESFAAQPACDVPLTCDEAGRVYCIVASLGTWGYIAAVLSGEGQVLGQQMLTSGLWIDSSPAFGWSGMAVAGYKNDRLYILE